MTLAHPPTHGEMCHNCGHCERPVRAKGLCNAHYKKLLKYGNPLAGGTNMRGQPRRAQYLAKVDQRGPGECWPWTARRNDKNYGQFADGNGGSMAAHRYGFEELVRPLLPGEELTPANSYGYKERRQCKTCARLAARGQHPRQLGLQPPSPAAA
jgi:hypothetical protein